MNLRKVLVKSRLLSTELPFNRLKLLGAVSCSRLRTYTEMNTILITVNCAWLVLGSDCGIHNVDGRTTINPGLCNV